MDHHWVGRPVRRIDGWSHVTGQSRYVDDISMPGQLYAKVLRSPMIRARIRSLDTRRAEARRDVGAVITARDVPHNRYGIVPDQPVLAENVAEYRGEPLAAVAAGSPESALEAVGWIEADLEEIPGVLDVREALQPDAPQLRTYGNAALYNDRPFRLVEKGDVDAAFREADLILENEYLHPPQQQAQLEPQISLALPDNRGGVIIHTVSQDIQFHHKMLCEILRLPANKVRIRGGTVGGTFGSKNDIHADHITALLALKANRPVKWVWTREEELLYSTFRGAWHVRIRDGVKKDGRIVARDIEAIRDAGSYALRDIGIVDKFCFLASGPYNIPNVRVKGQCVYTNKQPASSMRGYGITPSTFSVEIQMDRIAEALGMSPWDLRYINAFRPGDQTITKRVLRSVAVTDVLEKLSELSGVPISPGLRGPVKDGESK